MRNANGGLCDSPLELPRPWELPRLAAAAPTHRWAGCAFQPGGRATCTATR